MINKFRVEVASNWSNCSRRENINRGNNITNSNNNNNDSLDLDNSNQDDSLRGSAMMNGINVFLEIDEPRVIDQWKNVDLDLSKSQRLINVVKILHEWYKYGIMTDVCVGFEVPISPFEIKEENDKDKNKNKDKNDEDTILCKKKKQAISESKWVELIIKAIIHVFQFKVETKDLIRCLRKKKVVKSDEIESDMACFVNQAVLSISLELYQNSCNPCMLLLVKINPKSNTRALKLG